MKLSNFPFLTPDEFSQSCQGFIRLVDSCDDQLEPLGWANAGFDRSGPEAVLVVRRYIDKQAIHSTTKEIASDVGEKSTNTEDEEETEEYIEDDPVWQLFPIHKPSLVKSILTFDIQEALVRLPVSNSKCEVEYNVMLSPTYQVPVLYFFLPGGLPCGPKELPNIYNSLVPEQSRPGLRDVGVMGGVSITNHPVTGIPVYFVHPCATSEALKSVAGDKEQTTETYLLLWIGLIGNCVGLNVPLKVAAQAENS